MEQPLVWMEWALIAESAEAGAAQGVTVTTSENNA